MIGGSRKAEWNLRNLRIDRGDPSTYFVRSDTSCRLWIVFSPGHLPAHLYYKGARSSLSRRCLSRRSCFVADSASGHFDF